MSQVQSPGCGHSFAQATLSRANDQGYWKSDATKDGTGSWAGQRGRRTVRRCCARSHSGPTWAADVTGNPPAGKIGDFKTSLAEWSLHKALFTKQIDNLDFPKIAREDYGISAVEFVNQFFKDKSQDSAYLKDLKTRADDNGVACVLIMIDGEGDLSAEDKTQRDKAVENHKAWVDAAASLGCHSIRVNTGGNYGRDKTEAAAGNCRALAEYAQSNKINVICENHGGPSSNPDALLALIKAVGKPNFGTLPDFGNFPKDKQGKYTIDVYDAIARMMPHAKGVSAKSYNFDEQGNETALDFGRILKIVTDAGYNGYIGIEYEGSKLGEPEGIRATKKLMESLRGSEYHAERPDARLDGFAVWAGGILTPDEPTEPSADRRTGLTDRRGGRIVPDGSFPHPSSLCRPTVEQDTFSDTQRDGAHGCRPHAHPGAQLQRTRAARRVSPLRRRGRGPVASRLCGFDRG